MLRSGKELIGYEIEATDGRIGKVDDFLFQEETWLVRYLVAETHKWLPGRLVLLAPVSLRRPDWAGRLFPVALTREKIRKSPELWHDLPVSRRAEYQLHRFYGWDPYWLGSGLERVPTGGAPQRGSSFKEEPPLPDGKVPESETGLRSLNEVTGYGIHAADGEIGKVGDFILDDELWAVRYLVVDTHKLLPGRKVLVALDWVHRLSWSDRTVHVDLTREKVKQSPEYEPSSAVNREYEARLYDYYGRPKYW
jgi:hypothetical protein